MTTTITTKNFSAKLSAAVTGIDKRNANIQAIIEFGADTFNNVNGDTGYLTRLVQRLEAAGHTVIAGKVRQYIIAHVAVKWVKATDDTKVFKKNDKAGELPAIDADWYHWSRPSKKIEKTTEQLQSSFAKRTWKTMNELGLNRQQLLALLAQAEKAEQKKVS